MEKEDKDEPDFSSLNKYFRDDDLAVKKEIKVVKTIIEDVSISESTFRHYESEEFGREIDSEEESSNINSKKISSEKKEFLKSLDNDGLNLDTCSSINKD